MAVGRVNTCSVSNKEGLLPLKDTTRFFGFSGQLDGRLCHINEHIFVLEVSGSYFHLKKINLTTLATVKSANNIGRSNIDRGFVTDGQYLYLIGASLVSKYDPDTLESVSYVTTSTNTAIKPIVKDGFIYLISNYRVIKLRTDTLEKVAEAAEYKSKTVISMTNNDNFIYLAYSDSISKYDMDTLEKVAESETYIDGVIKNIVYQNGYIACSYGYYIAKLDSVTLESIDEIYFKPENIYSDKAKIQLIREKEKYFYIHIKERDKFNMIFKLDISNLNIIAETVTLVGYNLRDYFMSDNNNKINILASYADEINYDNWAYRNKLLTIN